MKEIKKLTEAGFTLIEMMIVVAIIGLIAGMVGLNVSKKLEESRISTTKIQIRQLSTTLEDFKRVCGFYPTQDQGFDALLKAPSGRECKSYPPEGFLNPKKVPQDAWNHDFEYSSDGVKFVIKSLGADSAEGGEGAAKDLTSDDTD